MIFHLDDYLSLSFLSNLQNYGMSNSTITRKSLLADYK